MSVKRVGSIKHSLLLLTFLSEVTFAITHSTSLTAEAIMEKNFFASKISKIEKHVSMSLINEKKEKRYRKIIAQLALQKNGIDSKMLVRFVEPKDIKGVGFLQHEHYESEDDLWIYLPSLHRSKRLISSNKKDSFIGSDFSYGDMLPPKVSLYQHKIIGKEKIDSYVCYQIESIPSDETIKRNYGYARKITWVDMFNFHERKVEYYDVTNRLLKTQNISKIILIDAVNNRWNAEYREMLNHQTGHKTLFSMENYSTEIDITRHSFTLRTLEWF